MSRTRVARAPNSADSRSGRANSFTRVAPGAENRSVIWVLIVELWLAASSSSRASRRPIRRAGSTKMGSRIRARTVICQEIRSITTSVKASATRLPTTPDKRVGEGPLGADHVVVQPADQRTGAGPGEEGDRHLLDVVEDGRRRSRISPSPIRADSHRDSRPNPASTNAIAAISAASARPWSKDCWLTIASTTRPASSGVATVRNAADHAEHQEDDQHPPVGPGEGHDPAYGRPGERPALLLGRHHAVQRVPGGEFHAHAGQR